MDAIAGFTKLLGIKPSSDIGAILDGTGEELEEDKAGVFADFEKMVALLKAGFGSEETPVSEEDAEWLRSAFENAEVFLKAGLKGYYIGKSDPELGLSQEEINADAEAKAEKGYEDFVRLLGSEKDSISYFTYLNKFRAILKEMEADAFWVLFDGYIGALEHMDLWEDEGV
jgi:hypothetical protein